ncbi:MAG: tRNA epoxyqueuosine(34) reductase QueG, partial [Rhodobacteraceae bacterium]|nr:tRNA epoxyqueuosine(34) reductase QueG [Paracoccaceae bacterium]
QLSGLGWQGKHTNLVSRYMGNWFFIGVMYIDKSLPVDKPEEDNCGSCTKCLDICPTNAFKGAYKLDARKCIAYLTIEHRGAIDKELRSSIGNRVFGCDDCLAICPWNKFAQITRNLNYRETFSDLSLEKALSFSDNEFRKFFSGTAVKRLGSTRFLRNVIYAMGNSGNRGYIGLLEKFLGYSVEYVSEAAAWSISELKKNA